MSPESYLVTVFLIGLNILLVGLLIVILDDMDYETWLRYLSAVIQNQGYLERPTGLELGMGDISGPRG